MALIRFEEFQFTELVGSNVQTTNSKEPTSQRQYLIPWHNGLPLAEALVGRVYRIGESFTRYQQPHRDPDRPHLEAKSAIVTGVGVPSAGENGAIDYVWAKIAVNYAIRDYDDQAEGDVVVISESRSSSVQIKTVAGDFYKWAEGPNKDESVAAILGEDVELGFRVPMTTITYDIQWWFQMPTDYFFEDRLGNVNDEPFTMLYTTWPKETLRFDAFNRKRQWTVTGRQSWNATLVFTQRRYPWNQVFDPEIGEFGEWVEVTPKFHVPLSFNGIFPLVQSNILFGNDLTADPTIIRGGAQGASVAAETKAFGDHTL